MSEVAASELPAVPVAGVPPALSVAGLQPRGRPRPVRRGSGDGSVQRSGRDRLSCRRYRRRQGGGQVRLSRSQYIRCARRTARPGLCHCAGSDV